MAIAGQVHVMQRQPFVGMGEAGLTKKGVRGRDDRLVIQNCRVERGMPVKVEVGARCSC